MTMHGSNRAWRPLAATGVVLALVVGSSAGSAAGQAGEPSSAQTKPRESVHDRLARRLSFEVKDQPLEDIVRFLEQATGVTMEAVWQRDGRSAGLDPDALISITASNEPALSLLERVLARVGDPLDAPTWQLSQSGSLQFGPRSVLNRSKRTVIYDINDLLLTVPDFADAPRLDLEAVLNQAAGGQAGSILEEGEGAEEPRPGKTDRAEEITQILTTLIEPEQWTRNGGEGATVRIHGGTLIIHAPGYIHRQIGG